MENTGGEMRPLTGTAWWIKLSGQYEQSRRGRLLADRTRKLILKNEACSLNKQAPVLNCFCAGKGGGAEPLECDKAESYQTINTAPLTTPCYIFTLYLALIRGYSIPGVIYICNPHSPRGRAVGLP